jgi:Putative amidase domain
MMLRHKEILFVLASCIALFFSTSVLSKTYDRVKAIEYHKNWYNGHNPDFYDYDNDGIDGTSDCTNYVSQILQAGGWQNTTNYGVGALKSWFYVKNSKGDKEKDFASKTWRSPQYLFNRFNAGHENAERVDSIMMLYPGDLVFIKNNKSNIIEHVMIVVARINGDITLGGHTNARLSVPSRNLSGYMRGREFIGFHIKDLPPNTKKTKYISFVNQAQAKFNGFDNFLGMIGIKSAFADGSLFAYVNKSYTVRVEGDNFDGNEAVAIDGSVCDASTVLFGGNYFTQQCMGGEVPGDSKGIRVYDSLAGIDIEVPPAYQVMSLRGPTLAPLAPTLIDQGSGTVRLTWQEVSGANGYVVYRDSVEISTTGSVLTFNDFGRPQGVQACYRIRAISNGGQLLPSRSI